MESNKSINIHIGLPSIVLIFVSLSIISFGILCLVSATSDLKLSQKISERTITYYDACNQAEEQIAIIDKSYRDIFNSSLNDTEYLEQAKVISLQYPISDIQSLSIQIAPHIPTASDNSYYQILCWQIVTDKELYYDDSLNIIDIF